MVVWCRVDARRRFVAGERGTEGAVTICMCPICGEEIGVLDSVVMTDEGWSHKRCGRVTLADEGAAVVEPLPSDEKLVQRVAAFLRDKVRPREHHESRWSAADDYARNLVQSLILDFDIQPRGRK